jgi:glycine dehydrogenase subunit 2
MREFFGNFGVFVRSYAYILRLGGEGLFAVSDKAVLNANYIRARLQSAYHLCRETPHLHEAVFSDACQQETGVSTLDVAKRLIDYGFHPPTVYFPLHVKNALMIEPTESESKETLDAFCDAMLEVAREAQETPEIFHDAPYSSPAARLDETSAARNPVLRWE